jgi:hypothetical protein
VPCSAWLAIASTNSFNELIVNWIKKQWSRVKPTLEQRIEDILSITVFTALSGGIAAALWGSNFYVVKNIGLIAAFLFLVLSFITTNPPQFTVLAVGATLVAVYYVVFNGYYGTLTPSVGGLIRSEASTPMLRPWTWELWSDVMKFALTFGALAGGIACRLTRVHRSHYSLE